MSNLTTLEPFDCNGDVSSVGVRWEKWKRALEIYLEAANIDSPTKKRATLLHVGGLGIQEIFYNLPGANAPAIDAASDAYEIALEKLTKYFSPKQSKVYERHIFRLIKQEPEEKFEKFMVRLRNQAEKCQFTNLEEHLVDQIVEKCSSTDLRKKILTTGDSVTLDGIVTEANALESVTRQLEEFNEKKTSLDVNKITSRKSGPQDHKEEPKTCFRCGSQSHLSFNCPAKDSLCKKCGYKGHTIQQCRTRANKRKVNRNSFTKGSKKARYDKPNRDDDDHVNYLFHIDSDCDILCYISEIPVKMVIDSGSKCNIINDKTWEHLKNSNITVSNQVRKPNKTFMAYASEKPLVVLGSFDAKIRVDNMIKTATFYVVKNGNKNLLGKDTAKSLGVLRIGVESQVEINAISAFPKFKNILVNIPIDKSVKPIIQPHRRIPIPLESKVNKKIEELVNSDIIEPVDGPSKWISPIVPVLKPNGDIRICLDMRKANKAIMRENHPLPTMNQLVPKFRKAKLFSRLDIKNAFHQIEINENCRFITTFISSKGLFRYKRLMFGISCAPEIFQKIMEQILLPCEGTVSFIDDIVIFGKDETEHNKRLKFTLEILKERNVLLNENKCVYNIAVIQF